MEQNVGDRTLCFPILLFRRVVRSLITDKCELEEEEEEKGTRHN